MTTTDRPRVTFSGEDRGGTFTDHLSDPVPMTLLRVDLMVLAGLVRKMLDKERVTLARLLARPEVEQNPAREESARWKIGQRSRLYDQLIHAAGPLYDEHYGRHAEEPSDG
jgi:hypothetical protein